MFFNADQTKGAVGAVVPEKTAHSTGPGQQHNLSPKQFPGQGGDAAPEAAEGAATEGAAAGGAEAGAASLTELAPLLLV